MKPASRFMPKFEPKKANKFASFCLIFLVIAILIYKPIYIAFIALLALLVITWSKFEQPKIDKYFEKLCEERRGLCICEFAKEFDAKTVDTWIIRATYEQLQAALPTKHTVPVKASDNLLDVLKLDEDDLDLDLVEEIAQRTGRSLWNYENNPYYGKVTTARNLVLFFNHQASANTL